MHSKKISCFIENKKGFSLIELIIITAIMVALIAVMAPSYIKYVKKARDAVIIDAAENVVQFCKTEFADNNFSGSGTIRLYEDEKGCLALKISDGLFYMNKEGAEAEPLFCEACGIEKDKRVKSDLAYKITINGTVFSSPILDANGEPESMIKVESEVSEEN